MLHKRLPAAAFALGAALAAATAAIAGEDCFNGPVPVDSSQRAQISVPAGHAVRLTFNYNAAWEHETFVCDALTGHRIETKGNYNRNREDWISPIDNTRNLSYFIVDFHKSTPQNDPNAFRRPWAQCALKMGARTPVEGQSGAYVDNFGFNDGGGPNWDNAVVTAYVIGAIGATPQALPAATLQSIRSRFARP